MLHVHVVGIKLSHSHLSDDRVRVSVFSGEDTGVLEVECCHQLMLCFATTDLSK
jgi:hypothetical protein